MANFYTAAFTAGMNEIIYPGLLDEKSAAYLSNVKLRDGKISALRAPLALPQTSPEQFGHYGTKNRSAVKFYGRAYWSINDAKEAPYYGGNIEPLGVPYPTIQPTLSKITPVQGDEKGLTGTYKYCMTFVNANGWESAPGSLTNYEQVIELDNSFVNVTAPPFPEGIAYAKVYRTANMGAEFFCVGEISTSEGSFLDKTDDYVLAGLEPISSLDNYPPPDKGKYLTESGGVFYLAVGTFLYFSAVGNPHAWPTLNFVDCGDIITGIAPEFQGVLVFTANATYRIVGTYDVSTVTKTSVPGNQGCVNYHTIAHVSNAPCWLSNDGICLWNGESLAIISDRVMNTERLQVHCAVSGNDKYILFLESGAIVYDRKDGGVFYKLTFTCDYAWYDGDADKIFLQRGDRIYEYGAGETLRYTYRSPYIGGGESGYKRFTEVIVIADGETTVSAYCDDKKRCEVICKGNDARHRIKLPFATSGQRLQVEINGDGKLKELFVYYG
jgi:hypothetical protein